MKFQPDRFDAHSITGYGPGWISVGAEKVHSSLVIGSRGLRQAWDCTRFEDLSADHFAQLALLDADRCGDHGHGRRLPHLQHPGWRRAPCGGRLARTNPRQLTPSLRFRVK
jgi:hypothetical protein